MEWADKDRQWFHEREAIQDTQRHEAARWVEQDAARLMAQQPELWKHTSYPMEDWGVYQEQRQEAQQNALEAQLARAHLREQERLSQER